MANSLFQDCPVVVTIAECGSNAEPRFVFSLSKEAVGNTVLVSRHNCSSKTAYINQCDLLTAASHTFLSRKCFEIAVIMQLFGFCALA
jgi:hypothetical protein